ncbi:MAG TPA: hypothetical protein VFS21_06895 [Roseiflexaceae bacterium]|nr:hypothetical protein [Roseiflexaceae bacterium]
MGSVETWLTAGGPFLAQQIDAQREPICHTVALRLEQAFPTLCYSQQRPDASTFQRSAFARSPERLHAALQVALRFGTLAVLDREYRWFWNLGPRFGVAPEHFLSMHRWYFEAVREFIALAPTDRVGLDAFEDTLMQMANHIASLPPLAPRAEPRRLA